MKVIELAIRDVAQTVNVLEVIEKLTDEATFGVKHGKLSLRQMYPNHVVLAEWFPNKKTVRCKGEGAFTVSTADLLKILRRARDEEVTIKAESKKKLVKEGKEKRYEDVKTLYISFPKSKREYALEFWEASEEEPQKPDLKLKARLTVETKVLIETFQDVQLTGASGVTFNGGVIEAGGSVRYNDVIKYKRVLGKTKRQRASYGLQYLKDILTPKFPKVTLRWSEDMPVLISYPGVNLNFWLAPRIE